MRFHKLTALLCGVLALFVMGAGKKISDYTETLELTDAWIYEIAVPGVTNYKVTFGTIATNIIARVPGGGGGGSLVTNANQFGASTTLTIKNGAVLTNTQFRGSVTNFGDYRGSNVFERYDVKYWGATGDGVTDDSLALSSAFRQGRAFLPEGRYVVTNLFLTNACHVQGAAGAVIVFKSGVTNIMLDCAAANVIFSNLEFDGLGTGTPASIGTRQGIFMTTTNGGMIIDCVVHGFSGYGVGFDGPFSPIDIGLSPYISGGYFYNNGVGFMTCPKWNGGEYTFITSSLVYSNFMGAWADAGNVNVNQNLFTGNTIGILKGNRGNGGHSIISDNTINHNVTALMLTNLSVGELVTGNTIIYGEVAIYNSTNVVIEGNLLAAVHFRLANNRFCQIGPNQDYATALAGYSATNDTTIFPDYRFRDGTYAGIATVYHDGSYNAALRSAIVTNAISIGSSNQLYGKLQIKGAGTFTDGLTLYNDTGNLAGMWLSSDGGGDWKMHLARGGDTAAGIMMDKNGKVGLGLSAAFSPTNALDVNGHASIRSNVFLANLRTNASPLSVLTLDGDGAVYETATTVIGSTQMVTAAIGTLTVTNAGHFGTLHANLLNLTNALSTNQVRLGAEDLTNSAAFAPQNGDLFSWDEGMKRWTNVVPRWSDVITNITVSTVGNVLLDFAAANVFKLVLRTNLTYTFTNTSYLTKRAKVYFLQDLIGARTLTAYALAGGLIQTNENMQFNTNASALELMAVEKGFWVTNLITEWQRDYNPRIGPSLLAQFNDDFNRANDDPMTLNASDGVGTWTSGPGTYNDCLIDFNTLRGSTGADNMARVLTPEFIANQSASVVLAGTGGNMLGCGPAVRVKSTTDGDCYFAAATSTTSITVVRVTDDGATITDTPVTSGTFTVPTLVAGSRITLTISGTTLEVFVNGVSQGTCTDATYSTGQPGIRMFNNTGGADSFTATDL